jgi:dephospho-CoA kinase
MLLVGLTGGIGSGKSTVARMLEARGAVVIDADELARDAIARGTPGFARVVEAFGAEVVGPDGDIDRRRLADVVFRDGALRAQLEAVVHPEVAERFASELERHLDSDRVVVYSVPLLVERGLAGAFDVVVVVEASEATRIERVRGRDMSPGDVRARIAAQATDEDRSAVADVVLHNDGSLEELERQVDGVWEDLATRAIGPAHDR